MSIAVAAETLDREWDIFISYAHEDSDWVNEHIYGPLLGCKTESGAADRLPGCVQGEDPLRHELLQVHRGRPCSGAGSSSSSTPEVFPERDMWLGALPGPRPARPGTAQLHPVLRESAAAAKIPSEVSQINWYPVDWPDWFERLCRDLRLTIERTSQKPQLLRPHRGGHGAP